MNLDMNNSPEVMAAVSRAKSAYEALEKDKKSQSLIADMYKAGENLNDIGGFDLMVAALDSFFPDDANRQHHAGILLNTLWSGIGYWHR